MAAKSDQNVVTFNEYMQGYWDLGVSDSNKRHQTVQMMVKYLSTEIITQDDMDYALRRLIRGLCSNRDSVRQGFALCLCELLAFFGEEKIQIENVLTSLIQQCNTTSTMHKTEVKDMNLGRIFGYMAIIVAEQFQEKSLDNPISFKTMNSWVNMSLKDKNWMAQVSTFFLSFLIYNSQYQKFDLDLSVIVDDLLLKKLNKNAAISPRETEFYFSNKDFQMEVEKYDVYQLLILVKFLDYSNNNYEKLKLSNKEKLLELCPILSKSYHLSNKDIRNTTRILMHQSSTFPFIHPMWRYLFHYMGLTSPRKETLSKVQSSDLNMFWDQVLREGLTKKINCIENLLGLFYFILQMIPVCELHVIVTKSLLVHLTTFMYPENTVATIAVGTFMNLKNSVNDNIVAQFGLALCLLYSRKHNKNSFLNKVIEQLLDSITVDTVLEYASILKREIFHKSENDECSIAGRNSTQDTSCSTSKRETAKGILLFLIQDTTIEKKFHQDYAFLLSKKDALHLIISFCEKEQKYCETVFRTAVSSMVVRLPAEWKSAANEPGSLQQLLQFHHKWSNFLEEGIEPIMDGARDSTFEKTRQKLLKLIKKMKETDEPESLIDRNIASILMQLSFLPLFFDADHETVGMIQDVIKVNKNMNSTEKSRKEDKYDWMTVLADVLISIFAAAADQMKGLRHSALLTWKVICRQKVSLSAFQCILDTACSIDELLTSKTEEESENGSSSEGTEGSKSDVIDDENSTDSNEINIDFSKVNLEDLSEFQAIEAEDHFNNNDVIVKSKDIVSFLSGDLDDEAEIKARNAWLQSRSDKKKSEMKNIVKDLQPGLHLRLRVVELLEIVASREVNFHLMVFAVQQIFDALIILRNSKKLNKIEEIQALSNRLASLLIKIFSLKIKMNTVEEVDPSFDVKKLFDYIEQLDKKLNQVSWGSLLDHCLLFAIGLGAQTEEALTGEKLAKYFSKTVMKKSTSVEDDALTTKFIVKFPQYHGLIVPVLLDAINNTANAFKLKKICRFLEQLLDRSSKEEDSKLLLGPDVLEKTLDSLHAALDAARIQEKQRTNVIKIYLDCLKKLVKRGGGSEELNLTKLQNTLHEIRETTKKDALRKKCESLEQFCAGDDVLASSTHKRKSEVQEKLKKRKK